MFDLGVIWFMWKLSNLFCWPKRERKVEEEEGGGGRWKMKYLLVPNERSFLSPSGIQRRASDLHLVT